MTKRVLVPIDGSEQGWDALEYAVTEQSEASLTLFYAINPMGAGANAQVGDVGYGEEWYETAEVHANELLEAATERVDRPVETATLVGRPAHAIVEFAEDNAFDSIVMGSHGRDGVSRILLGSVAETVVRRSPVPVTVVR